LRLRARCRGVLHGRLNGHEPDALTARGSWPALRGTHELTAIEGRWRSRRHALNLDDSDLGLMRLDDVYGELRKAIGGAQAARRLTSAGA